MLLCWREKSEQAFKTNPLSKRRGNMFTLTHPWQLDTLLQQKSSKTSTSTSTSASPLLGDQLFWILYILRYGRFEYESLSNKTIVLERQLKIQWITEWVRPNKETLKGFRSIESLTNMETNLADEPRLTLSVFFALASLLKVSVYFLDETRRLYYRTSISSTSVDDHLSSSSFLLRSLDNGGVTFEEKVPKETIDALTQEFFEMEHLRKPVHTLTSYKVSELEDMVRRLSGNTVVAGRRTKAEWVALANNYFPAAVEEKVVEYP
jgi:hypothetical protein